HIPISHTPPIRPPPRPTLFPYTTLFRSNWQTADWHRATVCDEQTPMTTDTLATILGGGQGSRLFPLTITRSKPAVPIGGKYRLIDRKSTRLNSSHVAISYAVFCLKKKTN